MKKSELVRLLEAIINSEAVEPEKLNDLRILVDTIPKIIGGNASGVEERNIAEIITGLLKSGIFDFADSSKEKNGGELHKELNQFYKNYLIPLGYGLSPFLESAFQFNKLVLENFTVFQNAELTFSEGLNVIYGENGSGKTHLLKLLEAYSMEAFEVFVEGDDSTKDYFTSSLVNLFQCHRPGSLVSRNSLNPALISLQTTYKSKLHEMKIMISPADGMTPGDDEYRIPKLGNLSLLLPSTETMTANKVYLDQAYREGSRFDLSYYRCAHYLSLEEVNADRELWEIFNTCFSSAGFGKVILKKGEFYIEKAGFEPYPATLEAEGIRKILMLGRLIRNGSLRRGSVLLWDEPEANLNAKLIRLLARVLIGFVKAGVQVICTTHDFFLGNEFRIYREKEKFPVMYHNIINRSDDPSFPDCTIQSAEQLEDLENLAVMEAEVGQFEDNM